MSRNLQYVPPVPIRLIDEAPTADSNSWVKDIRIGECTLVTGSNGVKFAVWSVTLKTVTGGSMKLLKRYREIELLRKQLLSAFPDHATEIPKLPPKKVFGNLKDDFLSSRRGGLEYFLSCVLLNPLLCGSDAVRAFVGA